MKLTALCTAVLTLAVASVGRASVSVALTPSVASPQPVGTRVIWIAQGASSGPGALDYRFRVRPAGGMFRIVRDFHPAPVFEWRHYENEGHYEIEVTARNKAAGQQSVSSAMFVLVSRVSGSNAVVSPTGHPLVMLYSASPCPAGSRSRAIFNTGTEPLANTPWKNCEADLSRNFLIAGLRPHTTYRVMHQLESNGSVTTSAPIPFTTIGLPAWLPFPQAILVDPPERGACFAQPIVLHANLAFGANPVTMPIATDIFGRVMWYYPRFASEEQRGTTIFRPLPGGNMLMAANDPASALGLQQILREIDLTGSPVRETNVDRISEQLVALGHDPITSIHHDIVQLPNGRLIALASSERVLTDVQGAGDVAVIGDMLIELGEDLQVGWVWNGFDHLDAARLATLEETCVDGQGGCPPVLAPIANDWLHSNSVSYTEDGNLLLSMRHQDWVVKIAYGDGTGTGAVLWRLGEGGDFTVLSADQDPWFSHQHDAEFDTPGVPLLTVFDNGNVRRASDPNANSRGQAFYLDETRRLAIPVVNADLGAYAFALGNAERLCNGGFHFHSGVIQPELKAQAIEVGADGRIRQMLETPQPAYRTFRMRTMYQP